MKRYRLIVFAGVSSIILLLPAAPRRALAQAIPADSAARSSVASDTVFHPSIPIPFAGTLDGALAPRSFISDSSVDFMSYRYAGDILALTPGLFVRDLGTPGQAHGITIDGADTRAVSFLNDGVPLNDPLTGIYNLNLYPTENIGRIEVITGTRAFLYGLNSSGGAINFVSKTKRTIRAFSRIRYSESTFEYGFFDGTFSQDVMRNLNLSLGVQHTVFGPRFPNDPYDDWSTRIKLRYNMSNAVNVYFSDIYNETSLGLNGGADTAQDLALRFDPRQSTVRNTDSYEKITRHDVQAGVLLRLMKDSMDVSSVTFFHNTQLREYRDEENRFDPNGILVHQDDRSQWYGMRIAQHITMPLVGIDAAAEIGSRGLIASSVTGQRLERLVAISGKAELRPADFLTAAAYLRLDRYLQSTRTSSGGDATAAVTSWAEIFGGFSSSYRFPTFQELYWRDSVVSGPPALFPERHDLAEAGLRLGDRWKSVLTVKYFHRRIKDPIVILPTGGKYPFPTLRFAQPGEVTLEGIDASAGIRIGSFYLEGSGLSITMRGDSVHDQTLPKLSATGGIYFWDTLFHGHLDLKVGLRGRVLGSNHGSEFNPQAMLFVPSTQSSYSTVGTSDLFIMFHIGSAYVHFIWENLIDQKYIVVPFYPMPDRAIKLGISWEFMN